MKKNYHHDKLRETLIETGIRLMNTHGYEQLSLRKIAAACGVSHAAPYRHFKDKETLLAAMREYVEEGFSRILRSAIDPEETPDSMLEFGKAYVHFFAENPQYYLFFIRQNGFYVDFSEEAGEVKSDYMPFQIFQEQAVKHLAAMQIPQGYYLTALASMWATVHGLAGLATMSGVHYDGDWAELTEKVLRGVEAHG